MSALRKGSIVEQLYRVEDVFEGGGMGLVYKVHHLTWGIDMVMKCPRSATTATNNRKNWEQFTEECRLWQKMGLHPYVATCFYSRIVNDMPCVFAEFVDGGSLRDWIAERRLYRLDSDVALAKIISLAVQTAWGLARAHEIELVHADVKPGNVLVTSEGSAKVTDFGLARTLENGLGSVTGRTPAYASPEQARGERVAEATDVWSWAVTVFEMFAGGICWENGPAAGACLTEFGEKGAKGLGVPKMPEGVFELLTRCLQWNPSARPPQFSEIAVELLQVYEQIFNEPCDDAQKPDLELVAADSLNNRAVSLLDLARTDEAAHLLERALAIDPQHPEATLNLGFVRQTHGEAVETWVVDNLQRAANAEPGNAGPSKLLGLFYLRIGKEGEAERCFSDAKERALTELEAAEIAVTRATASSGLPSFVLAKPRSGSDFYADVTRFQRLMDKTEHSLAQNRVEDAVRYARMAADIQGFGRHPQLRRAVARL